MSSNIPIRIRKRHLTYKEVKHTGAVNSGSLYILPLIIFRRFARIPIVDANVHQETPQAIPLYFTSYLVFSHKYLIRWLLLINLPPYSKVACSRYKPN